MPTKRLGFIALLGALAVFSVGAFGGFLVGRSLSPSVVVRPNLREIISSDRDDVTSVTSSTHSGATHSSGFSVEAFEIVGIEMPEIIHSVLGGDGFRYHAYVLPEKGGFHLVIHHPNSVPAITDTQYQELLRRVRELLVSETIQTDTSHPSTKETKPHENR